MISIPLSEINGRIDRQIDKQGQISNTTYLLPRGLHKSKVNQGHIWTFLQVLEYPMPHFSADFGTEEF